MLVCASPVGFLAECTAEPRTQDTFRVLARQDDRRVRPPASVTCDRNTLTLYSGRVTTYSRRAGRVTLTIQTDWDTTETVTLRHPQKTSPEKWFLLRGESFKQSDWSEIESKRGRLRPEMRVSAWVCNDGKRPIIDWQPSTGNENAPPSTP